MRTPVSLITVLLSIASCADPNPSADSVLPSVAAEMEQYVAEGRVAGVVTMVMQDDEVIHRHAAGFRDREIYDPLEMTDLFRIASQTKALTSVAAMILVEEGKLSLDDPVSKFIPEFAASGVARVLDDAGKDYIVEPVHSPITVRHLLTHTSGMGYGWGPAEDEFRRAGVFGWYLDDQDESIQEVATRIAGLPLTKHPGEDWVYGYSTDVLGAVVELASGMSLKDFLAERILEPLGMHDTHFYVPGSKTDRVVTVYGLVDNQLVRSPDGGEMESQGHYLEDDEGPHVCLSGGAGLVSTAPDYIRFEQMLLHEGELDGVRILSPESVREMTTNQVGDLYDDGKQGFGLGFRIQNERSEGPEPPGAYSWGGAYHSHYWIDPQNRMVAVILTQLIPATGSDIHARFKKLVYEEITR